MNLHINEKERIIKYHRATRKYFIQVTKSIFQQLRFCSWCGLKLPKDLSKERAEIVFEQLHLNGCDDPKLPREFRTDEWWKKRGL